MSNEPWQIPIPIFEKDETVARPKKMTEVKQFEVKYTSKNGYFREILIAESLIAALHMAEDTAAMYSLEITAVSQFHELNLDICSSSSEDFSSYIKPAFPPNARSAIVETKTAVEESMVRETGNKIAPVSKMPDAIDGVGFTSA